MNVLLFKLNRSLTELGPLGLSEISAFIRAAEQTMAKGDTRHGD